MLSVTLSEACKNITNRAFSCKTNRVLIFVTYQGYTGEKNNGDAISFVDPICGGLLKTREKNNFGYAIKRKGGTRTSIGVSIDDKLEVGTERRWSS